MAERFSDWHHKKHNAEASREDVAFGRKVLGQLVEELRLGKVASGIRRVTLSNGTTIVATVAMGIPSLQVLGKPKGGVRRRVFDLFGCINTITNIEVVKLGVYESDDYDGAPLVAASKAEITLVGTIALDPSSDPIGLAADGYRKTLYICSYSGGYDNLVVAELKDFTVTGVERPPVPYAEFHPWRAAVSFVSGKVVVVSYYFNGDGTSSAVLIDREAPGGATFVPILALTDRLAEDVAIHSKDKRAYICSGDSFGAATVFVIDLADGTAAAAFPTHTGFYEKIVCSADGKFLYLTGEDEPDPYPDLAGDQSIFVMKLDAATGAVLAKINGCDPTSLDVSPDGKLLVVNDGANNWLWLYETELMHTIADYTTEGLLTQPGVRRIMGVDSASAGYTVCEVRFTPDSKRIICTTRMRNGPAAPWNLLSINVETELAIEFESPTNGALNEMVLYTRRKPDRITKD